MKFIHAADIHLDSPLTGLASYADAPVELLRTATRDAFTNLVSEAIDREVDFVILAGDLYDGSWKDYNTGFYFSREMGRLDREGIPVYLLFGNHDAESEMTKQLQLPANVHKFEVKKPSTFRIEALKVALHGRSFKEAATTENLALTYPDPVSDWLNIGVLHTALEGDAAHAYYAPCTVAELTAKKYNYWALGHVHEHRIVQESPCWIVYPGNLQGRHIRETGPRGAVLVTVEDPAQLQVERLFVDVLTWQSIVIDATELTSLADVVRAAGDLLRTLAIGNRKGKPVAIRVTISGKSSAHGELFGMEQALRAEIIGQAEAEGGGDFWIEKVKIETSPKNDAKEIRERLDAVADLQTYLEKAPADNAFMSALLDELHPLYAKAPAEVRAAVPDLESIRKGDLSQLITTITPSLIARLTKES